MKSVYIVTILGAFAASATVNAQCSCDPADSACLSDCVGRTSSCISECQSNNDCYQSCITNHWPGADPKYQEPSSYSYTPTSTSAESAWSATPTAWFSSSMWSQPSSGAWPSSSGVPTNINPAASASIMPGSSDASSMQMSNIVIGLGLACAVYMFQ